jgi:DtxR family Mn-dependent transcriptional regulator
MVMDLSKGEKKYLLGVILTENDYGWTRLKWIAEFFDVKMSTVKEFLDSLEAKKLISHQKRGAIFLTEDGRKIAEEEKKKLEVVYKFLTDCLAIDREIAEKSAMKFLFDLDDIVAERLFEFIDFMSKCPKKPIFIDKFERYVKSGEFEVCTFCPVIIERGSGIGDGK